MPFQKIPGHKAPWEEIDQDNLRQFLSSVTGQRFLDQIFLRRPLALEKNDITKRALQSAVAEGYEEFYTSALWLCTPASTKRPPTAKI
jgi:hypothetical protein